MEALATGEAWTCPACGHAMLGGVTCELCGVARRMVNDPPLDIPYRPRLANLPAFWLAIMWSLAALGGALLWASPAITGALGHLFILGQVIGSGGAAVSSLFTALWQRAFNEVELLVPAHVRTGDALTPEVRLVPYETCGNVSVSVKLIDRYYESTKEGVGTKQRELAGAQLLRRGTLRGRRLTSLTAEFVAPFPSTPHESLRAEMTADLLGLLAFAVPALGWQARNLREHGGYYVEAKVSVGWLTRRYHRRVLTYYVGDRIHFG